MKNKTHIIASSEPNTDTKEFARRVSANLGRLTSELRPQYDLIVCGSGSSGSVVARRLNVLAAQNIRFDKTSVFIEPTRYGDPLGCWQRGKNSDLPFYFHRSLYRNPRRLFCSRQQGRCKP